jgi:hypothetical protein
MPETLKEAAGQPGVLHADEGISIKESVRNLRVPGRRVNRGTRLMVGSVVIFPDRVLAAVGAYPVLNGGFDGPGEMNATLTFGPDGVHAAFEVAEVVPGGAGSVKVHFRTELTAAAIASLPSAPVRVRWLSSARL